jgi:hypothetical protein
MRAPAADIDGRADRAVPGSPRALLLVELLRAAADRRTLLGGLRALPPRRELGLHDLVEEVLLHFRREDLVGQVDRADLFSLHVEDVECCHGDSFERLVSYDLISTSTPAERSSFMSASSVCWVGSRMSSKRLWVRISNCSRDFLST